MVVAPCRWCHIRNSRVGQGNRPVGICYQDGRVPCRMGLDPACRTDSGCLRGGSLYRVLHRRTHSHRRYETILCVDCRRVYGADASSYALYSGGRPCGRLWLFWRFYNSFQLVYFRQKHSFDGSYRLSCRIQPFCCRSCPCACSMACHKCVASFPVLPRICGVQHPAGS
ncbi:hypothetical protein IMSAGC008_02066 [Muribaculaceae bacterium]|nr:hypothetical protein IMSAGC008_02066 [Muribaculaceae bacterium]